MRRQKRKRWACAGSRTAVGGGLRSFPGCEADKTAHSGHQREALEGPRAVGSGCQQVARSSEQGGGGGGERGGGGGGEGGGGLRRSEEFVYSSNWESDSSALDEEREE